MQANLRIRQEFLRDEGKRWSEYSGHSAIYQLVQCNSHSALVTVQYISVVISAKCHSTLYYSGNSAIDQCIIQKLVSAVATVK